MHLSLAFLKRAKPNQVSQGGAGFAYIATPQFGRDNLGRFALVRPYTPPMTSVYGSGHPVLRSIGGPEPAVGNAGPTLLQVDPRGFAGNSPTAVGTRFSPLLNNQLVNVSNQQMGGGIGV